VRPPGPGPADAAVIRSFPANSRPTPRRLTLRPEHVAYLSEPLKFTPAKFNAGISEAERSIITSSGEYVVAWNFRKVKNGQLDAYTIKRCVGRTWPRSDVRSYDQEIVADSFRFNQDRDIVRLSATRPLIVQVVMQAGDVFQESKGQLSKPSRVSLTTPRRSDVVREWR